MHSILISDFGFLPTNLGAPQLLLVFFLILLLFGAKRLPELGRGLGKFVREFKKTTHEIEEDLRTSFEDQPDRPKTEEKKVEAPRAETGS